MQADDEAATGYPCEECDASFAHAPSLRRHVRAAHHGPRGVDERPEPLPPDHLSDDDALADILRQNWHGVQSYTRRRPVFDIINRRLWDGTRTVSLADAGAWARLRLEWDTVRTSFKINASYGCVLEHKVTGELRYYHSSSNNATLLERARVVRRIEDLRAFYDALAAIDLEEMATQRRPDTTWRLRSVTNLTFYVYKMLGTARIGGDDDRLPAHILRNDHVRTFMLRQRLKKYKNLCFFRCLAAALDCQCRKLCSCTVSPSTRRVLGLYETFRRSEGSGVDADSFEGVSLRDLMGLERLFGLRINVVRLGANRVSERVWVSTATRGLRLDLDLHQNHFSLISNLDAAAGSHVCDTCTQVFTRFTNLKRHKCVEGERSRRSFVGGGYGAPKDVFLRAGELLGRRVEKVFYPFRATFDIECYMEKKDLPPSTKNVDFSARHRLLSVSVSTNVPGFDEPVCFVRRGTEIECVRKLVRRLTLASKAASKIVRGRLSGLIAELESVEAYRKTVEETFGSYVQDHTRDILRFADTLPVVGFNSQKYDINVIKAHLVRAILDEHENDDDEDVAGASSPFSFIIKKDNKMSCIETTRLRFLDVCNFIAPGFSYAKYLKAYGCEGQKGFFPYEWVDSLSALDYPGLPPIGAFSSSFRNTTMAADDYAFCWGVWKERKMRVFEDFLVWYNNLDVQPMLEALENQSSVYARKGIDMLKDAVSLPGLAVLWKFKHAVPTNNGLRLPAKADATLYEKVRKNIIGGPSIVFHRYHEVGVTRIRPADYDVSPLCATILGVDANALYLYCMMQDMPAGPPVEWVRTDANVFKRKTNWTGRAACGWLAWCNESSDGLVQHAGNGKEVRLGGRRLPVDGFCVKSNTVYQFHGCYWHAHACQSLPDEHPTRGVSCEDIRKQTDNNDAYIRELGYRLITMRGCEWRARISGDPAVGGFVRAFLSKNFPVSGPRSVDNLLASVDSGKFFGFVEVDIRVPEELMSKFSEMAPLFTHAEIGREHSVGRMREWLTANGRCSVPQPTLVGVTSTKNILLLSSLLAWYRRHGLVVDAVHSVYEFTPSATFAAFGASVCDARRLGDSDPSKTLLADTSKLIGNSSYGKLITNKDRHRSVAYVDGHEEASLEVASRLFSSLNEINDDGLYEIVKFKRKVCWV